MSETTIERRVLTEAALALLQEGYVGPGDPRGTWFVDNEPDCGVLGTVSALGAAEASRPLAAGEPITVASHVGHLRYSLSLANRALRGENPYKDADWAGSWKYRAVSEAEWKDLVAGLRSEYEALRPALEAGGAWEDADRLTGTLGLLCHGAWHLGALRQALGLVKAPK